LLRSYEKVKLEQREYKNASEQKNWALERVKTEWVLVLDSDEWLSEEATEAIKKAIAEGTHQGYRIRRRTYFLGRLIRFCGWQFDYPLRIFRTKLGRYDSRLVHADVILNGTCGKIKAPLYHETYSTLDEYFEKFTRYTKLAAEDARIRGMKPSFFNLIARPCARFIRQYLLQLGFLDGKEGLLLCTLSAFSAFSKYARLLSPTKITPQEQ
ncbi:MAG: glycosyltransferase family 2 protein, partial [Planctomycetota bacterium]|nr:glycosyltransferase family 2 protein [Planctomycetota bacterium]